jgi:hypothetical protein
MRQDGTFRASDYASGFASNIYAGRNSPDLCGLVGMQPRAAYIMLPLQAGDQIDVDLAGGTHPNGDETASNDGWAAISGTSAAAPQLAGVAALIRQACPRLTPAEVRSIMRSTARDVTTGTSGTGTTATTGVDVATGTGLVDAARAVLVAKIRCLGPIGPIIPIEPIGPAPIRPVPVQPIFPIQPIRPIEPIGPAPIKPIEPIGPIPIQPIRPIGPVILPGPEAPQAGGPAPEQATGAGGGQLSADDVAALEEMIRNSEGDLDL